MNQANLQVILNNRYNQDFTDQFNQIILHRGRIVL